MGNCMHFSVCVGNFFDDKSRLSGAFAIAKTFSNFLPKLTLLSTHQTALFSRHKYQHDGSYDMQNVRCPI